MAKPPGETRPTHPSPPNPSTPTPSPIQAPAAGRDASGAARNASGAAPDAGRNASGAAPGADRDASDPGAGADRGASGAASDAGRDASGAGRDASGAGRDASGAGRDASGAGVGRDDAPFGAPRVLWQDDTALVADKPSGQLVHNSAWAGPREQTLRSALVARLGEALHPVNRLDRGASGLVLLSRGPAAARRWQAVWHAPDADKSYLALVRGHLREAVTVDHPLRDNRAGGSAAVARPARSHVTPVACSTRARCSLVRIRLYTGRRHQARRHLKHLAHPIVGDTTWGKGDVNRHFRARYGLRRLALHAEALRLPHPDTGARLTWSAPLPPDLRAVLTQLFSW
jgi:tRNA pseudouridine65 synthase